MDRKYLIPLAVGVGAFLLGLLALALFSSGNEEAGVGAGAVTAALLEAERRRQARAQAQAELEEQARKSEGASRRLGDLRDDLDETVRENEAKVKDTSLADLVDEENERGR